MKLFSITGVCLACAAVLLNAGCDSKSPDLRKVNEIRVQAKNQELSVEIREMEKLIEQAGAETPDLQQQLDEREKALEASVRRVTALRKTETELKLRQIRLNERLRKLRSTFGNLQSEIVKTAN